MHENDDRADELDAPVVGDEEPGAAAQTPPSPQRRRQRRPSAPAQESPQPEPARADRAGGTPEPPAHPAPLRRHSARRVWPD